MKKFKVSFVVKTSDCETADNVKGYIKDYLDIASNKSDEFVGIEDFDGYSYLKVKAL